MANCPEWGNQNIPIESVWDSMFIHDICLSCLSEDHDSRECPRPAPRCSVCFVFHEERLPCKSQGRKASIKPKEEENTRDETSRELKNGPEQHVPNAQAVTGKECESLSPDVIVDEEIPTTEPNGDKILLFAPSWLKKDSKFGSQKTCTSKGGSAPCKDKDMGRPSSRL